MGNLVLDGDDDDLRIAVIENVKLIPRELSEALYDDNELDIDDITFETIIIGMQAMSDGETLSDTVSTFAIDLCVGCLVTKPASSTCEHGVEQREICRPGQEDVLFGCADAPASLLGMP